MPNKNLPYNSLPDVPDTWQATTVLIRIVDTIGFRFRWATENLRAEDFGFSPGQGAMKMSELLKHMVGLVQRVKTSLSGTKENRAEVSNDLEIYRQVILATLLEIRELLVGMSDADLADKNIVREKTGETMSFWFLINGPLLDVLTHIGQINSWRRLAGNPVRRVNSFKGIPPKNNWPDRN